jgi:Flp pilus assembly protein CpaB
MLRPRPSGRAPLPRLSLRRLRWSPVLYWAAALVLAGGGGRLLLDDVRGAEAARHSWGSERTVMVAAHPLAAGAVLGADDLVTRHWPAAVVAPGALSEAPVGRTLTGAVAAGEALNDVRLAPVGASGTGALLEPGMRAVAVPTTTGRLALSVGDRVELVAVGPTGGAQVVAGDGTVLSVDEESITVAVEEGNGPEVAAAVAAGSVTPLLMPP